MATIMGYVILGLLVVLFVVWTAVFILQAKVISDFASGKSRPKMPPVQSMAEFMVKYGE